MIEAARALPAEAPAAEAEDEQDPDAIFALIERTAETLRALRENEQAAVSREQSARAQFERERAIWRTDLEELRHTVETCLDRAAAAEQESAEHKAQALRAVELCDETRSREASAVRRAETAEARARASEERYARLEAFLSKNFADLALRRSA